MLKSIDFFLLLQITSDFKMALMQARTAKGWKQKDLAQMIALPPKTVQDYENGTNCCKTFGVIFLAAVELRTTSSSSEKPCSSVA